MRLPEEIVADVVAPTLRALLSRALLARGLAQQEIADALGISQSAVSKHLSGRFRVERLLADDARVREAIERLADGLASRSLSTFEALAETMALVRQLENRGPVCSLHERDVPALRGLGCDLCVRLDASPVKEEQEVLANLRAAVRVLEASPAFAARMPSVGSNVAMALDGAKDRAGVAAVPGGLVESRGAVKAPASPEFGVSKHVAWVLLGAHAADPPTRAAVNVAHSDALLAAARAQGLALVAMDATDEKDPDAVARRVRAAGGADVLWHGGAFGVEANVYVLGKDAVDAARRAAALVAAIR